MHASFKSTIFGRKSMTPRVSSRKAKKKSVSKVTATRKITKPTTAQKKRTASKPTAEAPKLSRPPKGGLKDIGLLSFGKKSIRKKVSKKSLGAVGLGLASSDADRRRVLDTRVSPFRKVCDLEITAADSSLNSGTAWFITPRTLVTCGHCLFVHSPGTSAHGMVRKVLVMPARNGETDASESLVGWVEVKPENLRVHDRWRLEKNLDFDYGVIILPPDQPLGAQVGVFKPKSFSDQELLGARTTLSGYPDGVPEGTQWVETNPIRQVAPAHVFYDIFTVDGQSGSPVFFGGDESQTACAIHNFGNVPFNRGVRITASVIAQLNAWKV